MSDRFSIIPFDRLLKIILNQLDNKKAFFSLPEEMFFKPDNTNPFRKKVYGQLLETPFGVAAGPHTQLAQNIVAAWLAGARFIELKTIQTLDELEVSKPCIDMQDEGYNCEWSQELKIRQSFDQYLNAWIIIHILRDKFQWYQDQKNDLGTIFNMSVGYDYNGILNDNVQWYFDKMADASIDLERKINEIKDIYPKVVNLNINPQISNNVTLSTMHGCPPEEIEQIGAYLIEKRKLHTTIKLNPTLLGKEKLQTIIENSGFHTIVPDIAFEHDLKYTDALNIIKNLNKKALENNVQFGLKLTNTLESVNNKNVFSQDEEMMYASGRILHPISINLAKKLQDDFEGKLNISFSGGVNAFNIANVLSSGLYPVTVCSDLLKPGGYGRLQQYIDNLPLDESVYSSDAKQVHWNYLQKYSEIVLKDARYKKTQIQDISIKTPRPLKAYDCIHAPCVDTCPTNQDVPDYMYHTAMGDFDKAFDIITKTNPFPHTTGMVCDHPCQTKCTRINYDAPLMIREIKRFVSENTEKKNIDKNHINTKSNNLRIAIIGAGPAGLSSARYLREAGFDVEIFEQKNKAGGMVLNAIPPFRLTDMSISKDIDEIEKTGVKIHYGKKVDSFLFRKMQKDFNFIIIAAGAQKARKYNIAGQDADGVYDPLHFLFKVKQGIKQDLGKKVLVVGGGNTAMDTARTAIRLVDKKYGKVTIVYRRTIKQMPADMDEIIAAKQDGIEIMELAAPVRINVQNNKVYSLTCTKIRLGEPDKSGRRRPVPIPGSEFDVKADSIIMAIGQDQDIDFVDKKLLKTVKNNYQTQLKNVFIGGDALRGGSTVINAVADGRKIAELIINKAKIGTQKENNHYKKEISYRELLLKKNKITFPEVETHINKKPVDFSITSRTLTKEEAINEASRCLYCDEVCNICTTVCPNLAQFSYEIQPVKLTLKKLIIKDGKNIGEETTNFQIKQQHQILLLADWCNECGNCDTFCPTSGAPYKEKPHLYLNYNAFLENEEGYYFDTEDINKISFKTNNNIFHLINNENILQYNTNDYSVKIDKKSFEIINFDLKNKNIKNIDIQNAAQMYMILQGARQI